MHYCPWRDVGDRYPTVLIAIRDVHPARAVWLSDSSVIFVDASLSRAEGRCALAHEIAHMDLGHWRTGVRHFDRRLEREADRLAARRLIPFPHLAHALRWSRDDRELAEELNVDLDTIRARLEHLTPDEVDELQQAIERLDQAA